MEDDICLRGDRAIGRLEDQRCPRRRGVRAIDGIFERGRDQHVTLEAEQFVVGDEVTGRDILEEDTGHGCGQEGGEVDVLGRMPSTGDIRHRHDHCSLLGRESGHVATDVAEALDGHARPVRSCPDAARVDAVMDTTPRPVASTRPGTPPSSSGLPVATAGDHPACDEYADP